VAFFFQQYAGSAVFGVDKNFGHSELSAYGGAPIKDSNQSAGFSSIIQTIKLPI
jgi:hypothetical protein